MFLCPWASKPQPSDIGPRWCLGIVTRMYLNQRWYWASTSGVVRKNADNMQQTDRRNRSRSAVNQAPLGIGGIRDATTLAVIGTRLDVGHLIGPPRAVSSSRRITWARWAPSGPAFVAIPFGPDSCLSSRDLIVVSRMVKLDFQMAGPRAVSSITESRIALARDQALHWAPAHAVGAKE